MQRVNIRMIGFALVVSTLVGYPVYVYLDSVVSGGIKDAGGGVLKVDLKAMSSFSLDQENGTIDDVPKRWRDLDGRKVVLYGEMFQPFGSDQSTLAGFDLCYSIGTCCIGTQTQAQHLVRSRVVPGKSLSVPGRLVKVTGTLHVKVIHDDNQPKIGSVYQLDVENIEPPN